MTQVIIYELNEVPWEIVDLYVAARPQSHTARWLRASRLETTVDDDPAHLCPWRTWPTFHTGLYTEDHRSYELGQDPETFRGVPIWDVVEGAGGRIGLFGPMQSWPPRQPAHGGFFVPDTFAHDAQTHPAQLQRFQDFNLSMTKDLGFSADRDLPLARVLGAGVDMMRRGLTPWSVRKILVQLARERRDPRFKAARSIMQALPAFDLFWRLQRRTSPDLSIFFTNHVAGMMHRFWGDVVPSYSSEFDYDVDEIFARFVTEAMDVFDHQLGRLMRHVDAQGDHVLVVAASMGQAAIPYRNIAETYVLDDTSRLLDALQIGPGEKNLTMYPMNTVDFGSQEAAARAGEILATVSAKGERLLNGIRVEGRSVSFSVRLEFDGSDLARDVTYRTEPGGPVHEATIDRLGISTSHRLGGGNTAYHVPEGIFVTYGPGVEPDDSRARFDVREAAAVIMGHLGLAEEWERSRTSSTAH